MNERITKLKPMVEVDMGRLLRVVARRLWLVATVALLCAAIVFTGTLFLVTPKYQSAAMIYVNNSNFSVDRAVATLTSDAIYSARDIVETYMVILYARETLNGVLEQAGIDEDVDEFRERLNVEVADMISAERINGTEIFRVVVTGENPAETERIADAIAVVLPARISEIMAGTSAKIVDAAVIPSSPSSPDIMNSTFLGGLIGLFAALGFIIMREIYDTRIRSDEVLAQYEGIAILSRIPNLDEDEEG